MFYAFCLQSYGKCQYYSWISLAFFMFIICPNLCSSCRYPFLILKELSFCHNSDFVILILSLKYLRSTITGCRDIGIKKSDFVAETQFLLMTRIWIRIKMNWGHTCGYWDGRYDKQSIQI